MTPHESSFTAAQLSYGFFDENDIFQGTAQNLPENVIFALRGPDGTAVKVEFVDVNGLKASAIVQLKPIYQNYTFSLSGQNAPSGFDRSQIAQINFVVDQNLAGNAPRGIVKIYAKELNYSPILISPELEALRTELIQKGIGYFKTGAGLDPVTHFPYDNIDDVAGPEKMTQPTLIGFYLQMLGEALHGNLDFGMNTDEILDEIETVIDSLLDVQSTHGWNGLLPFLDLDPIAPATSTIGFGDNANLAQSLAEASGSLQSAVLTSEQAAVRTALLADIEQFLDNQEAGYLAFVDNATGLFRNSVNSQTGVFDHYVDRIGNEFRSAVAFLTVRYPSLPDSVWTNLEISTREYEDTHGVTITNLAPFDGGAFQIFWPALRSSERDFLGVRYALENHFITQTDYAASLNIPGFLSASEVPNRWYQGLIGVPIVKENFADIIPDAGSTYALASAYAVDPLITLTWLKAIQDQIPELNGTYGLFDSARSNTEISKRFLGIDIASTVLGLNGRGGEDFEVYLRNAGLELAHHLLYDQLSQVLLDRGVLPSGSEAALPPLFPDRSLAVFSHMASQGIVNGFVAPDADLRGLPLVFGALDGGFAGVFWDLDQTYNARDNDLVIVYSAIDSPQQIKLELKNENDQLLYQENIPLSENVQYQTLRIQLPDSALLEDVQKVLVIIDQNATGDTSGNFTLHALDFQHFTA